MLVFNNQVTKCPNTQRLGLTSWPEDAEDGGGGLKTPQALHLQTEEKARIGSSLRKDGAFSDLGAAVGCRG